MAEERLVREKMFYGFPRRSVEAALHHFRLEPAEFDVVALDTDELPRVLGPEEMRRRFTDGRGRVRLARRAAWAKKLISYIGGRRLFKQAADREAAARRVLTDSMQQFGFRPERMRTYDHHECHAASAFWPSPFDQALIVTSDGRGDGRSATIGVGSGATIRRLNWVDDLNSLGQFYAAVTFLLGFRPNRHEGKITGLAAFGDPVRLGREFMKNVTWTSAGTYTFSVPRSYRLESESELDDFIAKAPMGLKDRIALHGQGDPSTLLYSTNWHSLLWYLSEVTRGASREDVAAGAQYLVEEVCASLVERSLRGEAVSNVVAAGGVFANVKVNQRIRDLPQVSNLYVQPAMGDDGLSLGAALMAEYGPGESAVKDEGEYTRPELAKVGHTYLGLEYDDSDILRACEAESVTPQRREDVPRLVADLVHEGSIVGHFNGRMEFGPRALGNRSILARPTQTSLNDELNRRLDRTEFMPFAPSILAEAAPRYLIGYQEDHVASEYMTITYDVQAELQAGIAAVVHVDGTTRPHVVHQETSPRLHAILSAYERLSGLPVLVNTSFNAHEEPIVCTPRDAIKSLKAGRIDVLVMADFVVFP
jgi:carbamoyltransferase